MRIWSLHPKYLDPRGLVALWRETLLAKQVLEGKTKGYRMHPQLERFKRTGRSLDGINRYLTIVFQVAVERGYHFDKSKINWKFEPVKMTVTTGQLEFEKNHLLAKLKARDIKKYEELKDNRIFDVNPVFDIVDGDIESWEKIKWK